MSSSSETLQSPGDIDGHMAAAEAAAMRGDWRRALDWWLAALTLAPPKPEPFLGAAITLREAGQQDYADLLLGDIAARFPRSRPAATAYAASAHARADWTNAAERWASVQEAFPDYPFAFLRGAHALREAGRLDEAETVLETATQRFAEDEALAMAHAWLANARRDWSAARLRWARLRERFPDNPAAFMGGIYALRNAGCDGELASLLDQTLAVLDAATERGFDQAAANRMKLEIACFRPDWPAVRFLAHGMIANDPKPPAATLLALAQANWHLGDRDAADAIASRALVADPALADAVLVRAWVAADRGDSTASLALYRRLAELSPNTVRWHLKVVQLLNWFGEIDAAVAEIERLYRKWPDNPSVRSYMRTYGPAAKLQAAAGDDGTDGEDADEAARRSIAAKAPPPAFYRRPVLADDAQRDVQVVEADGADTAILIFAGDNDTLSIPLGLFDRFLAPLPATVIYLKDFNRLRYLRGVRSLAGDYAGTLAALRRQLAGLGVQRIRALGNCNGGFAAIRYGVELGADRIVTFQAPTFVPPEAPTKLEQAQNFMRWRLANAVPPELTDLKPLLQAGDRSARIEFFTRAENPRDQLYAAHLAGIDGINFHPCPGPMRDALLYRTILTDENFQATLANWLGL